LKKKILIFIDWYKPGYKAGGPIQSISNIVNQLHAKVDFYIVTRNTDYLESIPYSNIDSNEWNIVDDANVFYLSESKLNSSVIKTLIKEINPDTIYCNSLFSFYFSIFPIFIAKKLTINHILSVRGMLSDGSLSVKNRKKDIFLALMNFLQFYRKTLFHATTIAEKDDILKKITTNTIVVANNLSEKKEYQFISKQKKEKNLKLVSIGRISPEKNTLFAIEVLKNVKSNITFDIYGPIYNQGYWDKCLNAINQMPSNIVINYNGVIDHQLIEKTLLNYHSIFLPSTGENYGHIIIEAMINSCIPIISDKTPWKNLEEQNVGFDLPLEDENLFAIKIDYLASLNSNDFNKMSQNSYQFAHQVIFNKEALKGYYDLFQL